MCNLPFRVGFGLSSSHPPAILAVRGRVLRLVSLVIAPAFSLNRLLRLALPATLAVRVRFLTVVFLVIVAAVSFNRVSSRFSRLQKSSRYEVWEWVLRSPFFHSCSS